MMTMIVGIHLEEYIIVASDCREVTILNGEIISVTSDEVDKFVKWNGGIITGCGYVPLLADLKSYLRATEINTTDQIVALTKQAVSDLPPHASAWKKQTHWMFNYLAGTEQGSQCRLGYIKSTAPDEVHMLHPMSATIWAKLPDIDEQMEKLNGSLKALNSINEFKENFEYHINLLNELFSYASTVDQSVSKSFNYYIQLRQGEEFLSTQA